MALPSASAPEPYQCEPFRWRVDPVLSLSVPKARSDHRIFYHEGAIYAFGGFNPLVERSDPEMADDPHWNHHAPLFKEVGNGLTGLSATRGRAHPHPTPRECCMPCVVKAPSSLGM